MNNRHHPYGGYDERQTRGGRGGTNPSMRGRPSHPGGMSPPPSGYQPAPAAYTPAASNMNDPSAPYQPQNAYSGSNEFSGGPDRHYQMPMSGGGGGGGPQRGGLSARAGSQIFRPPPSGHDQNMSSAQAYGYTPDSYETASYNTPNPYDQSATSPAGQPPYAPPLHQPPLYSQDYNPAGAPLSTGPPAPSFDNQAYGPPSSLGQPPYRPGPPQGSINFETDSEFVEQQFKQFGEIKTFFDMVNKRGIAFITYYDLRAARDAMLAMKGAIFGGRPINIHYSLPREEDKAQRCDRDKNQGTLFTVLKAGNDDLSDNALHQVFSEFGDLKKIRDYPGQRNSRFVEYFDSRACQLAHDRLNGQSYLGGQWDLKFAWDVVTDEDMEWAQGPANQQAGGQLGFQAGPPGTQSRWGQSGPPPADYSGFEANGPSGGAPPSLGYGRAPIPPTGAPVDNGWGRRAGSSGSGPSAALSPTPAPAAAPGQAADAGDANRLEQAQKVQALLASLGAASKPPAAATSTPPAPSASSPPARSPPQAHVPAPSAAPGLPPNIAALLQSAAGAPKPMQPPKPQSPPTSNAQASTQDGGQQSVHQLLSMLNQNRPPRPS
uniref:RRM domain-containing protein n=1 Tax=Melanopsichium pennsylvanicum 4 TaxID=1398559 RepID=A0A077RBF9_9BASI|nr:conserved hypothetical protein [Melanopsichium pennsylvanicum 4]